MQPKRSLKKKACPVIKAECLAVFGSELHYKAMIYHSKRTAGKVPSLLVHLLRREVPYS